MFFTQSLIQNLSNRLQQILEGFFIDDIFSVGKKELCFNFSNGENKFAIKLFCETRNCFLFFDNKHFPKPIPHQKPFKELIGLKISSIYQHKNNRSFQINFSNEPTPHVFQKALVFKLYDGLSNVLYYEDNEMSLCFRKNIENDFKLRLEDFNSMKISGTYVKSELENFVDSHNENIFEAFNQYNKNVLKDLNFNKQKQSLIKSIQSDIKKYQTAKLKSELALKSFKSFVKPDEIANIIMANLQSINSGIKQIELFDFYRNKNILIKLKSNLNPQQNAKYYYDKAKNSAKEFSSLEIKIQNCNLQINELESKLIHTIQCISKQELKQKPELKSLKSKIELFKQFEFDGWKILVGKNAANNDLLTTKYCSKNDLWLHAKSLSGSHVVIKQNNKEFSKAVIEFAAQIAAYYSKSKGSSLVPVSYTLKKYIRKPKGAETGQVVVERENVILVKPGIG